MAVGASPPQGTANATLIAPGIDVRRARKTVRACVVHRRNFDIQFGREIGQGPLGSFIEAFPRQAPASLGLRPPFRHVVQVVLPGPFAAAGANGEGYKRFMGRRQRADLFHVAATVRMFDPTAIDRPASAYHGAAKAMRRSDLFALCKALEASARFLDTRQIARHVITVEGWDGDDARLKLTMAHKVGATMKRISLRGAVRKSGERDRASVWVLGQRTADQAAASS